MKKFAPNYVLSLSALAFGLSLLPSISVQAGSTVELSPATSANPENAYDPDSPAWHRRLWEGSFDSAGDASGAAARNLEGLDYGDCSRYLQNSPATDDEPARHRDENLYWTCVRGQQNAGRFAGQARSIQKQQKVMSVISKASDVAALASVGAVIYGEMGVKQNNQAYTFDKAANIQRKAGEVSYATGAADFAMGAYAYVAHKNRLEQIQRTVSGVNNGVQASTDPAVVSSITSAVEASKQAAYNHMLYGAGKIAAGYGMMYLAKQSAKQAERMHSIDELQFYNNILAARAANGATSPTPQQQVVIGGSSGAPYYNNNQPVFIMPNSAGNSLASGVNSNNSPNNSFSGQGSSTGSSVAPTSGGANLSRNLSSAIGAKASRGGGSSGGMEGSSGSASAESQDEAKEKATKEALSSFEMQLTGGPHPYAGGGSSSGGAGELPNPGALTAGGSTDSSSLNAGALGATGLSPNQVYREALEGTDGTEQGSMAGVNGKRDISLFEITKSKLTKMFQTGNVGVSTNVEVKN